MRGGHTEMDTCIGPVAHAAGGQFVVVCGKDVVILKRIARPSMRDFDVLVSRARRQARNARMKRSDVRAAVHQVRKQD